MFYLGCLTLQVLFTHNDGPAISFTLKTNISSIYEDIENCKNFTSQTYKATYWVSAPIHGWGTKNAA